MSRKVGVDLGGTWLRAGVVESVAGGVDDYIKQPAPVAMDELVKLLSQLDRNDIDGFGVAVSGPIEDHARVVQSPNIPWLKGKNLRHELEGALGKRVVIANDMEAATEGEIARGVLQRFRWAIFDTISTGWGGNLVLNGIRVDGEPGHANLTFNSPYRCGAGHVGCREALYSGSAMERRIAELLYRRGGASEDLWNAFHQAAADDADWALALLDDWAEGVGRAWGNLLNQIRPLQAIVYMGTTAESLLPIPRVEQRIRATMQRICMYPEHRRPDFPIVRAEEEHRAIHGAAIIWDRLQLE